VIEVTVNEEQFFDQLFVDLALSAMANSSREGLGNAQWVGVKFVAELSRIVLSVRSFVVG